MRNMNAMHVARVLKPATIVRSFRFRAPMARDADLRVRATRSLDLEGVQRGSCDDAVGRPEKARVFLREA